MLLSSGVRLQSRAVLPQCLEVTELGTTVTKPGAMSQLPHLSTRHHNWVACSQEACRN